MSAPSLVCWRGRRVLDMVFLDITIVTDATVNTNDSAALRTPILYLLVFEKPLDAFGLNPLEVFDEAGVVAGAVAGIERLEILAGEGLALVAKPDFIV